MLCFFPADLYKHQSSSQEIFSYVIDGEVLRRAASSAPPPPPPPPPSAHPHTALHRAAHAHLRARVQLSHQDSMGNKESLGRGAVQYLSAGTGITHSEMNDGAELCRSARASSANAQRLH